MKTKRDSKHVVGRFYLGHIWVELRIDPSHSNGSVCFIPFEPEPQITVIEVGTASGYSIAVATLLHEAFECVAANFELRFKAIGNLSGSAANCIFVMTHSQFDEIADRTGHFLARVLPTFRKSFLKHRRKGDR